MAFREEKMDPEFGYSFFYNVDNNPWKRFVVSDTKTGVVIKVGCRKINLTYDEATQIANDIIGLCSK